MPASPFNNESAQPLRFTLRILPALLLLAATTAVAAEPPVPPPPRLEATAWVLVDQSSGQVLAGHRANEAIEPASITKLMTAYAVFHALKDGKLKLDTPVPVSEHAWRSEGSRTYLDLGSQVPVEVLIQGMIVQSGNDATIALAEAVAGTEDTFAALMNQYAERLGLAQSHFQNSTGLPGDNHKMSAADMAKLARAIIREFPEYYRWYSQREFTWNDIRQPNRNGLLARDPSVDGVKTGMTEAAGYCLVSSAKREGMRLVAVVAGTKSMKAREDASLALLNYRFSFYETRALKKGGEELAVQRVYRARGGRAAVGLAGDLLATLPRGQADRVEYRLELAPRVFAPLTKSDRVGVLRALVDGKVVAEAPVQPLADVPRGNIFRRIWDTILSWLA
jgi:D-alanyl-D-alanine carboxypeptidase (penicillin-binding protein 5/6)